VQVLDFPLCAARYRPHSPLVVLREAASLTLEGRPRSSSSGIAAPLPAHAMPVMNRLFTSELALAEFQKELAETHAHRPEVTPAVRAAHLGLQAVILALPLLVLFAIAFAVSVRLTFDATLQAEQARRAADVLANPVARAKLPESGNKALDAALANPRLQVRVNDLVERTQSDAHTRRASLLLPQRRMLEGVERSMDMNPPSESVILANTRGIVLWAGAPEKSDAAKADTPWGGGTWRTSILFIVIPAGLILLSGVFRGGMSLLLAGIAIVRADGRPALRRQCVVRAAVVWLPVVALLFGATLLQIYAPRQSYLAAGLWLLAAVLLPVYAVVAVRFPSRPPQDRLVGTYLVPV
jgi:hypothetical protein